MTQATKLTKEQQTIKDLSDRIVAAQQPIRILDAIKWGNEVKDAFFAKKCKELPKVDVNYYNKTPLNVNCDEKREEFYGIERDIKRLLGQYSGVGGIMTRMCTEYRTVLNLLEARGTPEFGAVSQELYGSSNDVFYAGAPTLNDLAITLSDALINIKEAGVEHKQDDKIYTADESVKILGDALRPFFANSDLPFCVESSDGIIADASAGAETIRLKSDTMFSKRELRLLEVHEGWVHVGTTRNGMAQPVCTFLSKGPPSSTITQEGLAVLTEIFTFSSSPARVHRITNRINAIHMAEEGADFLEVFKFFKEHALNDDDAYAFTARVFRGSIPNGLPFTKDLAYNKGFINIYNFIKLALTQGLLDRIPLLFIGKTCLQDMAVYAELLENKTIVPPMYMPPHFKDLSALSAWMCYALFINTLDLNRIEQDYKKLL